jgi:hypothetical protein
MASPHLLSAQYLEFLHFLVMFHLGHSILVGSIQLDRIPFVVLSRTQFVFDAFYNK